MDTLCSRGEFYTAYTPYQAEASQGAYQAIFEYQTAMAPPARPALRQRVPLRRGTALYEAIMMAVRHTKRTRIVISERQPHLPGHARQLHDQPQARPGHGSAYRLRHDATALMAALDDNTAAVLVQNPNFFGTIEDLPLCSARPREHKIVSVISTYPVLQSVLKACPAR